MGTLGAGVRPAGAEHIGPCKQYVSGRVTAGKRQHIHLSDLRKA